jgi:haloalkane dehalogenase
MQDWCFRPECLRRFQQSFPAAEVYELADVSHYVVEDAHERIGPLVESWIERHPLDSSTVVRSEPARS